MIHKRNFPVERLTSFHQSGTIDDVYIFESISDIQSFLKDTHGKPFLCIGKGSNSLIHPSCFSIPVCQLSPNLTEPKKRGETLQIPAGMHVSKLMQFLIQERASCLEFSAGVPATVGGMIAMNFGCWGTSISDIFLRARVITSEGTDTWYSLEDMGFDYRYSRLHDERCLIVEAEFRSQPATPESLKSDIDAAIKKRLAHQPLRAHTFGSIFKNPPEKFAGQLLDHCGLKGFALGPVKLSDKHANFMENLGGATYNDAEKLLVHAIKTVEKQTGILLELEVKIHKKHDVRLNFLS